MSRSRIKKAASPLPEITNPISFFEVLNGCPIFVTGPVLIPSNEVLNMSNPP